MRIPTLGALTLAAAAAVVALPTAANAAAPTAADDTAQASFQTAKAINVLANDSSDPGTTKTLTSKTNGTHGSVNCSDPAAPGVCTYTPDAGWRGTDTFTYTFSAGASGSATGKVTVETGIFSISVSSTPANLVAVDDAAKPALRNPSHKITGTVMGSDGLPVAGVQVQLYSRPNPNVGTAKVPVTDGLATSDADGKIVVPGLHPIQKTYYSWKSVAGKSSTERSVTVTPFVTADYTSKRFAKGQSFSVSGVTGPVTEGQTVLLQRKETTGWTTLQSLTLGTPAADNSATFGFDAITHAASGAFLYRVVVPEVESQRLQGKTGQTAVNVYSADITGISAVNSDEFVAIKNNGKVPFNLKGWRLSDNNSDIPLPSRTVAAGGTVKVHTGKGFNNGRNLYLGKPKGTSLWANSGTVELRDNATPKVLMDSVQYPA